MLLRMPVRHRWYGTRVWWVLVHGRAGWYHVGTQAGTTSGCALSRACKEVPGQLVWQVEGPPPTHRAVLRPGMGRQRTATSLEMTSQGAGTDRQRDVRVDRYYSLRIATGSVRLGLRVSSLRIFYLVCGAPTRMSGILEKP